MNGDYVQQVAAALGLFQDTNHQRKAIELLDRLADEGAIHRTLLFLIDSGGECTLAAAIQLRKYLRETSPAICAVLFEESFPIFAKVYALAPPQIAEEVASVSAIFAVSPPRLVFPNLPATLIELLRNPAREEAGLKIARQYADYKVDLGSQFAAELVCRFESYPDLVLEIASEIVHNYSEYFSDAFVSHVVCSVPFLSERGLRYVLQIVRCALTESQPDYLIAFLIDQIRSGPEWAAYTASDIFKKRQLIAHQNAAVPALLEKIDIERQLSPSNLSMYCLTILMDFVERAPEDLVPRLMDFIEGSLPLPGTTRIALRALSAVVRHIETPGDLFRMLVPFLDGEHCGDAAFCLAELAGAHPEFAAPAAACIFEVRAARPPGDLRLHLARQIEAIAAAAEWPPQPWLALLLQALAAAADIDEQYAVWGALAAFCQQIRAFEPDPSFEQLFAATVEAFADTRFRPFAYSVFAALATECQFCFPQIMQVVAEAVLLVIADDPSEKAPALVLATAAARGAASFGIDCTMFFGKALESVMADVETDALAWVYAFTLVETANPVGIEWATIWLAKERNDEDDVPQAMMRSKVVKALGEGTADPLGRDGWIACVGMLFRAIRRADRWEQIELAIAIATALARVENPQLPQNMIQRLMAIADSVTDDKQRGDLMAAFARVNVADGT
jgi:hypothetical protein